MNVNFYRRWLGDYKKKTAHLSIAEHGVYGLLLDTYYASEAALPGDLSRLYRICGAITQEEQDAVRTVAEEFFPVSEDGLRHNARADEELGKTLPLIQASRENGKKGGRKKPAKNPVGSSSGIPEANPAGSQGTTRQAESEEPSGEPAGGQEPITNNQEPRTNTKPKASAVFKQHQVSEQKPPEPAPIALADAKIETETPAAILASILLANGFKATPFHPLVVEWAKDGITVDKLKQAIATARMRKGEGSIPIAYLDPILADNSQPIDSTWRQDERKAAALCGQLGIPGPKRGEDLPTFHSRIQQALADNARRAVA